MGVKKSIGNLKMLKPFGHFFFWEVLKDKVYSQKPRGVGDMKNYIKDAFQEINTQRDLCENICKRKRQASKLVNQEGKQFEYLC